MWALSKLSFVKLVCVPLISIPVIVTDIVIIGTDVCRTKFAIPEETLGLPEPSVGEVGGVSALFVRIARSVMISALACDAHSTRPRQPSNTLKRYVMEPPPS